MYIHYLVATYKIGIGFPKNLAVYANRASKFFAHSDGFGRSLVDGHYA